MLADPEMEVPSAVLAGFEVPRPLKSEARFGGGSEVCRASNQPGHVLREHIEYLAGSVAASESLWICRECGEIPVPSRRQFAVLHLVEMIGQHGILGLVLSEFGHPRLAQRVSPPAHPLLKMFADSVGYEKLSILGPAV